MAGERVKLEVTEREGRGSADSRRLRNQGLVPGVLYGRGKTPHPFVVHERELRRALSGDSGLHAILDVVVGEGDRIPAVLKDYQQAVRAASSRTSICTRSALTSRSRRRSGRLIGEPPA